MNFDPEKISEFTKDIRMTAEEKAGMRRNILRAVREMKEARPIQEGSFFGRFIPELRPLSFGLYAVLLISVALGSAASYSAQNALPGDSMLGVPLYSVKTGVNEKFEQVLAFSEESKAQLEAEMSERRLEEAEELAVQNRFDPEVRTRIEASFERHADNVQNRIAELEERGQNKEAVELSAKFEKSLATHAKILSEINGEETLKFLPKVRAHKKAAGAVRMGVKPAEEDPAASAPAFAPPAHSTEEAPPTLKMQVDGRQDAGAGETAEIEEDIEAEVDQELYLKLRAKLGL